MGHAFKLQIVVGALITVLIIHNFYLKLELENLTLKNYIIDLKARVAVYVPIKGDPVDMKIGISR